MLVTERGVLEYVDCLLTGLDECGCYLVGVVDFVYDHFGECGAKDWPVFHF
jgi:hypothetical protein